MTFKSALKKGASLSLFYLSESDHNDGTPNVFDGLREKSRNGLL
jgi:hypothetical protein